MRRDDFFTGGFLKADSLKNDRGEYGTMVLTIAGVDQAEFDDGGKQIVLSFEETDKQYGFSANIVWNQIEAVTGQNDTDRWIGHRIELYVDPNVTFKGKTVKAIRIRKPQAPPPPAAPAAPPPPDAPPPGPPGEVEWTKATAWQEWLRRAGPGNQPNAGEWRDCVKAAEQSSGKPAKQFGSEEWGIVAAGPIPF